MRRPHTTHDWNNIEEAHWKTFAHQQTLNIILHKLTTEQKHNTEPTRPFNPDPTQQVPFPQKSTIDRSSERHYFQMIQEPKSVDTQMTSDSRPTKDSDLSDTSRSIHIVTTASLPWLTGTAVNPLLRAIYFQRSRTESAAVTLVVPWVVKKEERQEIYPNNIFADGKDGRKEQEALVRKWIEEKAGMADEAKSLRIQFYPASYQKKLGSILPLVDICSMIRAESADIAILEEPEHLTWFSMPSYTHGKVRPDEFLPTNDIGWMAKFKHVVGIIHTNYPAYARAGVMRGSRTIAANTIQALSKLVCRSYCHKIIKLSKTLPVFASYKECECNVHGVRSDFLKANEDSSIATKEGTTQIYFIGKILWAKGFQYMLDGQEKYNERFGGYFPIDVYGGGPEFEQVKRAFFGVRGNQGATPKEETKEPPESSDKITDDENGESHNRYSQLSQMMLKSMPFLKDEIEETDENSSNENSSTLKTIKDSFQLVRNFQKESLLEKVPRNKYEWRKKPLPAQFCGPKDHAALKFSSYKVFVNPSVTEVLCTTTAEALAMGKFVVLPKHPSNEFFYQFPNCLSYGNMDEFVELVHFALNNVPTPLSAEMAHRFTWEAAMKRLIDAAAVTQSEYTELEKSGRFQRDRRKAWIHKESGRMLRGDTLKSMVGEFPLQDLKLKDYELDADLKREDDGHLLYFDNNSPKVLALLSFIIAILSYFAQR